MNTAFLFPGQGAQTVGMGLQVAQAYPSAARVFKKANEIVGYDLQKICFEGPQEQLNSTTISQPAIFVTSAAFLEVLRTEPQTSALKPDVTAGLSLGEYTALYAAGAMSFEDTLNPCSEIDRGTSTSISISKSGVPLSADSTLLVSISMILIPRSAKSLQTLKTIPAWSIPEVVILKWSTCSLALGRASSRGVGE
jgi:malonyl CoA-acyl carrier protein transacylase